jgi:topoisomerase-4 subunit A
MPADTLSCLAQQIGACAASGRVFSLTLKELADWRGNRADAGRLAPKGFPRSNKFSGTLPNSRAET